MSHKEKYDLTRGGILDKLLLVAVPIMGTQFVQMAYNLTDMFWLGRVGSGAVAASGTAGMYLWLSMGLLMFGRMGAEIGVSQRLGAQDEYGARGYAQTALALGAVLGTLYGLAMALFSRQLIGVFGIQEAQIAADAAEYLAIVGLAVPLTYITGAITGTFNGAGNSRVSFICNAAGLAINMALDPPLISAMGIRGAAIATAIAQGAVCALFLVMLKKGRSRPFARLRLFARPDFQKLRQIVRWSLPISLESLLFTLLSMVITRFVAAFGAQAIAVNRVGSQIESLSWLIGGGFGSAITAFIGQNFGAGKWTRIRRGFQMSVYSMLLWGAFSTLLLLFAGAALFRIFLPEPDIVAMGAKYLRILALCQIVSCLECVASGAFRGVGQTIPPSLASIVSNAVRIPLAYGLSRTALGLDGIWRGIVFGAIMRSVWIFIWYLVRARKQPRQDTGPEDRLPESAEA